MIHTALRAVLGGWVYLLYAAIIAAFVGWVSYEKHSYDNRRKEEGAQPFKDAIANQKREAKLLLAAEIAKNEVITKNWIDYARSSDDEYEKQMAALRAAARAADKLRLTDPGRRNGNNCPAADPGSAGAPQDDAANGQLSLEAGSFLRSEADRADEIVVWAKSCFVDVNAK